MLGWARCILDGEKRTVGLNSGLGGLFFVRGLLTWEKPLPAPFYSLAAVTEISTGLRWARIAPPCVNFILPHLQNDPKAEHIY